MAVLSPLARAVKKLDKFPVFLRAPLLNFSIGRAVPFFSTGGLKCVELSKQRAVVTLKNRRKVQNHIKGIHASAMVLLAENTTGLLMGMNIPNEKVPVIKSLTVDFNKRCSGDLTAIATIGEEQIGQINSLDKGDTDIQVILTDSENKEPVRASMTWAWIPKQR
jgi:acyl-coenzyme A thioesterase PaaI-like protein